MGCARSGTTLLASVIGNSPVTADYRAETLLLHGCEARYGSLSDSAAKSRFELDWLKSRQFRRSGLEKETARELILRSRSYAEFLGAYMGEIAKRQAKTHWIDSTPSNVFELKAIAENFPTAKVINIVRDGRAVAASLRKLGWTVFNTGSPWSALQYAALKWESAVKQFSRGRELFPGGVFETTYEALIGAPGELPACTLAFSRIRSCYVSDQHTGRAGDCSSKSHVEFGIRSTGLGDIQGAIDQMAEAALGEGNRRSRARCWKDSCRERLRTALRQ